jgi:hypothetical protein
MPPPHGKLFLSHAHADKREAQALRRALALEAKLPEWGRGRSTGRPSISPPARPGTGGKPGGDPRASAVLLIEALAPLGPAAAQHRA